MVRTQDTDVVIVETSLRSLPPEVLFLPDDSIWVSDWKGRRILCHERNWRGEWQLSKPVRLVKAPRTFEAHALRELQCQFSNALRYIIVRHVGGQLRYALAEHFAPGSTSRFDRL